MRIEEVALLRAWQVPDPDDFGLDKPARMEIFYGTKGGRERGDPEKKGKPRTLRFELPFLVVLSDYKRLWRKRLIATRYRGGEPAPEQLFLSDDDGRPLSRRTIHRAFTDSSRIPYKGWSPHPGRHAFACTLLLRLIEEDAKRNATFPERMARGVLMNHAESLVKTYLRPLLGHVSERTTELYLQWIADEVYLPDFRVSYSRYLEGETDG